MDFITKLPDSKGGRFKSIPTSQGYRYLQVIHNRLSKEIMLEPMHSMDTEAYAKHFIQCQARYHQQPRAITSNQGPNWVSRFQKHVCRLLQINQRLSTAYHPETDGGPERINQEIKAYLSAFIDQNQEDQAEWVPAIQMILNNRVNASTGISAFFITHGY